MFWLGRELGEPIQDLTDCIVVAVKQNVESLRADVRVLEGRHTIYGVVIAPKQDTAERMKLMRSFLYPQQERSAMISTLARTNTATVSSIRMKSLLLAEEI